MPVACDTVCNKYLRVEGMYTGSTPRRLAYQQRGRYSYHKVTSSRGHRSGFAFLVCVVALFSISVAVGAGFFAWYLVTSREDWGDSPYNLTFGETQGWRANYSGRYSAYTEPFWTSTQAMRSQTKFYSSPLRPLSENDLVEVQKLRTANVTDDELSRLAQILWDNDVNRLSTDAYTLDLQAVTNVTSKIDRALRPLFVEVIPDLYSSSPTYEAFMDLLDNYEHKVRLEEKSSVEEELEIDIFLDTVLETVVWKEAEAFLRSKGIIKGGPETIWELVYRMWFEFYPRSSKYNTTDSCGFEHVFVGETRGNKAMGLHSWVQFYLQEKQGRIDYQGYIHYQEPRVMVPQFLFYNRRKRQGSFFIGTSPEFDLALYTVCFMTRHQEDCNFVINHVPLRIQVWDIKHKPGLQVGTAYLAL